MAELLALLQQDAGAQDRTADREVRARPARSEETVAGPAGDTRHPAGTQPASAPDSPPPPGELTDVWQFFLEPAVTVIQSRTQANPLLPIFILENPYPTYEDHFVAALKAMLPEYRVVSLTEVNNERLANILVRSADQRQLRLILVCTSRKQLPNEFYSLVREDGYCNIPRLTEARLRQYAADNGLQVPDGDPVWVQWIGPQELLFANALDADDWGRGLQQLARQRLGEHADQVRTLDQLYGIEKAKSWARQLKNDIRLALTPDSGVTWDEVDQGALLAGPPGTGKTTLARAIAAECQCNFLHVKPVSDWMSGNGLDECIRAMAATFATARQQDPCIVFIDEIDSIGNRQNFAGHNASWNTAFLNALLSEMDGFPGDEVVVIAATNYPENVDPALRRAGRLDRVTTLPRPDTFALKEMLLGKLNGFRHQLTPEDLQEIASMAFGLTGADVEVLVRGARRRARLDGNRAMSKQDFFEEIYNIPRGAERKPLTNEDLRRTACHESGHALLALRLPALHEHVRIASIVPDEEGSLGFVALNTSLQNETRQSLLDRICMALGGRAAECVQYGEDHAGTGAGGMSPSCDLAVARRLTEALVGRYGFSERRPNWYTDAPDEEELVAVIQAQYRRAVELIESHRRLFENLQTALLTHHVLDREALDRILADSAAA